MQKQFVQLILLTVLLCMSAEKCCPQADSTEHARFKAELDDLVSGGHIIAKTAGKDALLARYRSLLDKYPRYPEDLQIEMQMGRVYTMDLPELNQPSDYAKAFQTYLAAIQDFDPDNPFMKAAMLSAAELGTDQDHEESERLFRRLLDQYPNDDALRLHCYFGMGLNSSKQGQKKFAEEYYSIVMSYDPIDRHPSDENLQIQVYKKNSALGLFWLAADPLDPPEVRFANIQAMLRKYPEIGLWHSAIVEPIVAGLQKNMAANLAKAVPLGGLNVDTIGTDSAANGSSVIPAGANTPIKTDTSRKPTQAKEPLGVETMNMNQGGWIAVSLIGVFVCISAFLLISRSKRQ